jgi:hypothetical protein
MMWRTWFVITVLSVCVFAQRTDGTKEPQFTDYPAPVAPRHASAAPRFSTPGQRRFRTVIRDWTTKGPNFAGHYTIAEWGCGTGCEQIAVVDNESGSVYEGPFGVLPRALVCLGANVEDDKTGIFYHADSALLIVRGCPNWDQCGTYYYLWNAGHFRLLRKTPMKMIFGCGP